MIKSMELQWRLSLYNFANAAIFRSDNKFLNSPFPCVLPLLFPLLSGSRSFIVEIILFTCKVIYRLRLKNVMFFQAVDGDSGRNGQINYKITSGDVSLFAMDEQTGDLELLSPINLESNQHESQYFLEITSYNVLPYSVPTYTNHTATVTINIQVTLYPKSESVFPD